MKRTEWIQPLVSQHQRIFVVSVFVLTIIAHLPHLVPGGPTTRYPGPLRLFSDEGTVLYDSFRITGGEVMYRDFFEFHGPVFYYLHAGLFAITGPSIGAGRALNLLITAVSTTLIALLVARSLGLAAGAGAAALHACLLVPMWPYAYPHWLAEALAFLGIYLLSAAGDRSRCELAGGALLGLSATTIQSQGFPILAACMAALAIPGIARHSWKEAYLHPLRVFTGALLGVSPFILYFAAVGALPQSWYSMFEWVFTHYPQGQKDVRAIGYGAHFTSYIIEHIRMASPWRDLAVNGLWLIMILPVLGIGGAILVAVQSIIAGWRRSLNHADLLLAASVTGSALPLILGISRADMTHIAFVGGFGLCGVALLFSRIVSWKPRLHLPLTLAWVVVGFLVLTSFAAKTITTYGPSRRMEGWRGEILKLAMARWIDANVGAKDRIVIATGMGGYQYLYVRRSAVGFTYVPESRGYFSDEQWRELGGQILRALPPVMEMSETQWLEVKQRAPEIERLYRREKRLFLRVGFTPHG